eukprot:gnl/TRDRNA2_/TRDRNA2_181063_c0_seq1.p1 gnl/TRDRNA2_/TRDRNA2_181063_c0~~gnl/TRDRNA2_/TRDRNA2_181063_c0_seq1.p1  ORF type:complete len:301 (+),score=44.41 gnl/TRDRNA2_/TRDRNA2_181063_c0_seq1:100-903(+)
MAGQPVVNPYAQVQAPSGAAPGKNLDFYAGPTGAMPPSSHYGAQPSGGFHQQPPVGGSIGQPSPNYGPPGGQMGGGVQQPGRFPPPQQQYGGDDDFENEPPILEELGINVEHIWKRMQGVAFFKKIDEDLLTDADLSGPLVICLALGCCLLLAGKLQFGYIYGLGAIGCVGVCLLINVMSQRGGIDLYRTMSILGYGLIPIVFLAALGIVVSLKGKFGVVVSAVAIFWSTATSSRFFATAIAMHQQRWLVAYPVGLVYTCFTLITVF